MKFAIIAAGEGSRLTDEGVLQPKPLVQLGGECLVDRLLRIFIDNGATEIAVICNAQMTLVREHLEEVRKELNGCRVPLHLVVKNTPSSMHSLYELSELLEGEPFVLTTVDTIFREEEFAQYVETFRAMMDENARHERDAVDGLMGVTDYIDDEKPLYVDVDNRQILNFYDTPTPAREDRNWEEETLYVSAGIYGLSSRSLKTLKKCVERGEQRMRNFQRALIADGMTLHAWRFSKVLDIDHASDITKAENFLKEGSPLQPPILEAPSNLPPLGEASDLLERGLVDG